MLLSAMGVLLVCSEETIVLARAELRGTSDSSLAFSDFVDCLGHVLV